MGHGPQELWIQKANMEVGMGWGMGLGMFCRFKSGTVESGTQELRIKKADEKTSGIGVDMVIVCHLN